MGKRITIKDIAELASVSVSTVHLALNNKPGVSDDRRKEIQKIAKAHRYKPNIIAASLHRKTIRIVAAFPGLTKENRYYYTHVWNGIRDYMKTRQDYNIELIEIHYYDGLNNQIDELKRLLKHKEIHGLLTLGYIDNRGKLPINEFVSKDIPIILVGTDLPLTNKICCVQPNYDIIGRMLAELLTFKISEEDRIILCEGDTTIPSHYLITKGFESYLKEKSLEDKLYKINSSKDSKYDYYRIVKSLNQFKIGGACSVNARSSVLLGQAIENSKIKYELPVIGSDIFDKNIEYLEKGIFTHLIFKNPYKQSYIATKKLVEYILLDIKPQRETITIPSELVFQSTISIYKDESYKLLY